VKFTHDFLNHQFKLFCDKKIKIITENNHIIPTYLDIQVKNYSFYSVPIQNIIDNVMIIMIETFSSMIYNKQNDYGKHWY
jgi:hypothetical protein